MFGRFQFNASVGTEEAVAKQGMFPVSLCVFEVRQAVTRAMGAGGDSCFVSVMAALAQVRLSLSLSCAYFTTGVEVGQRAC